MVIAFGLRIASRDSLALFTLALVVTGVYVWLTWKLLVSQREPALVVYLAPSEKWVKVIDVVIKNWGTGPAIDVIWTLEGTEEAKARFAPLFRLALFQRVASFPPGVEIRSFVELT